MKLETESLRDEASDHTVSPALASLIAELRAEEPPEPAWDAVEKKLLLRLARGEGGSKPSHSGLAFRKLAPIFAAAAAIALTIQLGANSGHSLVNSAPENRTLDAQLIPRFSGPSGELGDLDLSHLRRGDVIESQQSPIAFVRAGVVRWKLAPASRVVVVSAGGASGVGMVVSLERGSLQAFVEPRPLGEGFVDAFAIECAQTRVGVHGTAFTVTRIEQAIVVDVDHGVVAVGPAGHRGPTSGYSLVGPGRASFSLDGARTARFLPRVPQVAPQQDSGFEGLDPKSKTHPIAAQTSASTEQNADHTGQHTGHLAPSSRMPSASTPLVMAQQPPETKLSTSPPPDVPAPLAPPPPSAWLTTSAIKARIEHCIKEIQRNSLSDARVSIASTLQIKVNEAGNVVSAKLNPPLAPHLAPCAGQAIAGKFESGPSEASIPLSIVKE